MTGFVWTLLLISAKIFCYINILTEKNDSDVKIFASRCLRNDDWASAPLLLKDKISENHAKLYMALTLQLSHRPLVTVAIPPAALFDIPENEQIFSFKIA